MHTTKHITDEDVFAAARALQLQEQESDSPLVRDLFVRYTDLLKGLAVKAPTDTEEANSMARLVFMETLEGLDLSTPAPAARLYKGIRHRLFGMAAVDLPVSVPSRTAGRYNALRKEFVCVADQGQEWVERATQALNAPDNGHAMTADTFLATHHAVNSRLSRETTHPITVEADEYGFDVAYEPEWEMDGVDVTATCDTRDLVRTHLLPLLAPDQHLIVIVTYGFVDLIPEALDTVLAEKGVDLSDGRELPLSSRMVAEVLGVNGYGLEKMGYKTVQRRLADALDVMRDYLAEDERREIL